MKTVVYTCITGDYDLLKKVTNQSPYIDFVCFTDNEVYHYSDSNWSIRSIPSELFHLSKVKQQRCIKILPHRYLNNYDISLWIDGNIEIISDVSKFISSFDLNKYHFYTRKHPGRDCVYEEAKAVLKLKKDIQQNINPQMTRYFNEGFPRHYGLEETCIILRKHNERDCQTLCNMWANELLNGSHRDQLSFDYCRWKLNQDIGYINMKVINKSNIFRLERHG